MFNKFIEFFEDKSLTSKTSESFYEKVKRLEGTKLEKDIKKVMDSFISEIKESIVWYSANGERVYIMYLSQSYGYPDYIQNIFYYIENGKMTLEDVKLTAENELGKEFTIVIKETALNKTYELTITWK